MTIAHHLMVPFSSFKITSCANKYHEMVHSIIEDIRDYLQLHKFEDLRTHPSIISSLKEFHYTQSSYRDGFNIRRLWQTY